METVLNKIVINDCYGGFDLSEDAIIWLKNNGLSDIQIDEIPRHHPLLVECVETLGEKANGMFSNLVVKVIVGNIYRIDNYDGLETIIQPYEDNWIVIND